MSEAQLEFLMSRHSTPARLLGEPGPDDAQLETMLRAAVHVPDHARLTPWRFVRIARAARAALGERFAAALAARDPATAPAKLDKERTRFAQAPLVLAVVCTPALENKVPEIEQVLSAGCASFSLLLAAHALGFSAQWLTGPAAYDASVHAQLGLFAHERIVAFVHVGTPRAPFADRERPDPATRLSDYVPR